MISCDRQKSDLTQILVVDDTLANLKLLTDLLFKHGYQVRPVSSSTRALKSVAVEKPDLIILDVMMPEMDGYEVCRRLKLDEHYRDIPVIFISALDEAVNKVIGFKAGGVDYITKPFQEEEILIRVETHLALSRLQQQVLLRNILLEQEIVRRKKLELELFQAHGELGLRVAERTKELEDTNRQLKFEISQRRQAQKALAASEEKFSKAFRHIGDVVGIVRLKDRRYIEVNDAFYQTLGYSAEEVLEHTSDEFAFWDNSKDREAPYEMLRKSGMFRNVETQFHTKAGETRIGLHSAELIEISGEQCIVFAWHDITERKRAEEELLRARSDLELQVTIRTQELQKLNEKLSLFSTQDGLTGIANRRYFDEFLERELQRGQRQGTQITLIMADLDYFKGFNDIYGHQTGDACLKAVASVLKAALKRGTDLVARFGGEEFSIVLLDTEKAGALLLAEEIRAKVEALKIEHKGSSVNSAVTISLGVAMTIPGQNPAPAAIIATADKALYQAKHEGRNRVILYEGKGEGQDE